MLCRCVCVLSLDRFADYSLGGSTVAPVREVAAQLLALLLTAMLEMDHDDDTEGRAMAAAVVGQLEVLGSFASEWEVRHGAMLALKYLAAALHADKQHHGKVRQRRHARSPSRNTKPTPSVCGCDAGGPGAAGGPRPRRSERRHG